MALGFGYPFDRPGRQDWAACFLQHSPMNLLTRVFIKISSFTILPLLKNPPEPQKLSVTISRGDAVLVRKFQRAPHVVWPFIMRGSLVALSKNNARVGETTIASSARTPDVPFWTNSQPAPETKGTLKIASESTKRPDEYCILAEVENVEIQAELSQLRGRLYIEFCKLSFQPNISQSVLSRSATRFCDGS